jgi:hypothetical protein
MESSRGSVAEQKYRRKGLGGIRLLAVSPKFENRGIGQRLLLEVESILVSRPKIRSFIMLATQGNYLVSGVDPDHQRAVRFLEKCGYRVIDTAQDFTGEVGLLPSARKRFEVAARAGYRIMRASAEHVPSLLRLVHAVNPGWELEVRRALSNTHATVHVACDGHNVAGFSCTESNNVGTEVLGPFAG